MPIAFTILLNLFTLISEILVDLLISSSACCIDNSSSAFLAWVKLSSSKSASILAACDLSFACSTAASSWIFCASAVDWASALACPVLSTAALSACSSSKFLLSFSASASSKIFCPYNYPLAACSSLSAPCLAAASCEIVVISIASWTDFS